MNAEEYKLNITMTQARYHTFNLTSDQAEKVYWVEYNRDIPSRKHSFSLWEERDYELTAFKEILNDEQFKKYSDFSQQRIERHEQWLTEQNEERIKDILYLEEMIGFYENKLLPDLLKEIIEVGGWLSEERNKIDYLKKEYRLFLNETKKRVLVDHFRHNRMFMPNGLKASLLRHQLICIIPDYDSFEHEMDEPTKAVAEYLKVIVKRFPEELTQLIKEKFEKAKDFNDQAFQKYHEPTSGWNTSYFGKKSEENEKLSRSMTLLLMDKDKYDDLSVKY